jgi:alginate O-acetyltransferase complex protein AlgI
MDVLTNTVICLLLPSVIAFYYLLNHFFKSESLKKGWLILCSFAFYFYLTHSNIKYLLLSLVFNFFAGKLIIQKKSKLSKPFYWGAIATNIILFIAVKYRVEVNDTYRFLIASYNSLNQWVIPIGFGLITIQQISFLRQCYKAEIIEIGVFDYLHFSTFFPKLIAGPITSYQTFAAKNKNGINYRNISLGIYVFFIGLGQKVLFADTLLTIADRGLSSHSLNFVQAWVTVFCNTFGIYFNLNSYTSMAIGLGFCFNIILPFNFNYPFKALNIKDYWERWHITFTQFYRKILLEPIEGNKQRLLSYSIGILLMFFVMSLWHKIGFPIIIWGLLNACSLIIFSLFNKMNIRLPKPFSWLITFAFINVCWIFFRTEHFTQAIIVISGLINIKGLFMYYNEFYILWGIGANFMIILLLIASLLIVLKMKNIKDIIENYNPSYKILFFTIVLIIVSISFNKAYPILYYGF